MLPAGSEFIYDNMLRYSKYDHKQSANVTGACPA